MTEVDLEIPVEGDYISGLAWRTSQDGEAAIVSREQILLQFRAVDAK